MATVPFSSSRRRMTVAYKIDDETVRVVVKGAPEEIIPRCITEKNSSNERLEFEGSQDQGREYLENVVSGIASQGFKPLTIAYQDVSISQFEDLQKSDFNFESEVSRQHLEGSLCLVATVGFQDTLRSGVSETIAKLKETNTKTRLISGDHKDVVIYTLNALGMIERDQIEGVISGSELSERMEGLFNEFYDQTTQRKRYVFADGSKRQDFERL
jgi:magnesium-transporting ATPase (P-type)